MKYHRQGLPRRTPVVPEPTVSRTPTTKRVWLPMPPRDDQRVLDMACRVAGEDPDLPLGATIKRQPDGSAIVTIYTD